MLAKHVHHELLPTVDEDEDKDVASATSAVLPVNLVERAIQEIMVRNNYGIDVPSGVKPPAALCVWRWEVKPEHVSWLPKNSREKAESRQAERAQVRHLYLLHIQTKLNTQAYRPKKTSKPSSKHIHKRNATQSSTPKVQAKSRRRIPTNRRRTVK